VLAGANNEQLKPVAWQGYHSVQDHLIPIIGQENGFTSNASNISNLAPGNYDLSITDAGGCPITKTYTITDLMILLLAPICKKTLLVLIKQMVQFQSRSQAVP
jgi:hypothetical protein